METYRLMYLPKDSLEKSHQILKSFVKPYQNLLTNPIINCYECTPAKSTRLYSHYGTENTDIHDKLKILYDTTTGFVCSILKAYHTNKKLIIVFYESQNHHIFLLKLNVKKIIMPVHFNNPKETRDWRTLKFAQVYLKFKHMKELNK